MIFNSKYKVHLVASKDTYRPALCGVLIREDTMVATNGHAVVIVPIEKEEGDVEHDVIIPAMAMENALKGRIKALDTISIKLLEDKAEVKNYKDESVSSYKYIDEPYPNIDYVMPQKDDYTHEVGINPIYIKAVADALGMSKIQALQFNVKDSDSAIQVKRITEAYEDEKKESCIIMPVRLN